MKNFGSSSQSQPLVSVIMPVYNAGRFLGAAIESILQQTYSNFELIIVDDASTDNSWQIIQKYTRKDKRIRAFRNLKNVGVSATANLGIALSKSDFIARMDADDIAFPHRLEEQLRFLQKNPQVVAVGGQCLVIDEKDRIIGQKIFPLEDKKLKEMIFWAVPIQQSAMMVNRRVLPADFSWYEPQKKSAEEIDLLFRLMKYGQLANLTDYILYYRYRPESLSHRNPKKTFWFTFKSRVSAIKDGYHPSAKGIILTLLQVAVVGILPNKAIITIWYLIRGIKKPKIFFPSIAPQPATTVTS